MNSSGHLTVSDTAAKRMRKTKASTGKPKGRSRNGSTKPSCSDLPAAGTLARTKAVLRVRNVRGCLINKRVNSRNERLFAQSNRCVVEYPQAFVLVRHDHHQSIHRVALFSIFRPQ